MASLRILIALPNLSSFEFHQKGGGGRRRKMGFLPRKGGCSVWCSAGKRCSFLDVGSEGSEILCLRKEKDGILMRKRRRESLVVVRSNGGFGFNGGGGGGNWDKGSTSRAVGNLALAVGFTYLSMTGQLGWVLDAIVSVWLLAVLLPIVGLGIFFWYAGRDIVQSSCPNCGNDFQILKSSLNDGIQLCPFCTQPFSVQGNKFVRESTKFSSGWSKAPEKIFNGFSSRSEKGKGSSATIVDIEAEVKDIE